jgi:hypothetical protein
MKTIYEALVAAGPYIEEKWGQHSEVSDPRVRGGMACAEALNELDISPDLALQVADAILSYSGGAFPATLDGLKLFWKVLISKHRA